MQEEGPEWSFTGLQKLYVPAGRAESTPSHIRSSPNRAGSSCWSPWPSTHHGQESTDGGEGHPIRKADGPRQVEIARQQASPAPFEPLQQK